MSTDYLQTGRQVLRDETEAMRGLDAALDEGFNRACQRRGRRCVAQDA